jgi:hypothetical protein
MQIQIANKKITASERCRDFFIICDIIVRETYLGGEIDEYVFIYFITQCFTNHGYNPTWIPCRKKV